MWYLNETNTEIVSVSNVKQGDIITLDTTPAHGFKVHISRNGRSGRREIQSSGARWTPESGRQVLRLLKHADGTVKCATNR